MRPSTRNKIFATGSSSGPQTEASRDANPRRQDLLKDFEVAGWVPHKEFTLVQLIGYIEGRIRELSQNPDYSMIEEEKKAVEKLFSSLDKNADGSVSVREFVDGLVDYQAFCSSKQGELHRRASDIAGEIRELTNKKETEEDHKESFQKLLKVEVMEAKSLSVESGSPYVIVHFDNQTFRTRAFGASNSPSWHEQFNFTVRDPKEKLNVAIWTENPGSTDKLQGMCVIELPEDTANEQDVQSVWKPLYDEDGKEIPTKLRIGIQYLFDPFKLLDMRIRQKEEEKLKVQEELNQLLEFNKRVANPFDVISSARLAKLNGSVSSGAGYDRSSGQKLAVIEGLVGTQIASVMPTRAQSPHAPFVVVLFYVGLSTFIAFAREDFLNLLLSLGLLYLNSFASSPSKSQFRWISYGIIASLLYDVITIFLLHDDFLEDREAYGGVELYLRRAVFLGMILMGVGKIGVAAFVFKQYTDMPDEPEALSFPQPSFHYSY